MSYFCFENEICYQIYCYEKHWCQRKCTIWTLDKNKIDKKVNIQTRH